MSIFDKQFAYKKEAPVTPPTADPTPIQDLAKTRTIGDIKTAAVMQKRWDPNVPTSTPSGQISPEIVKGPNAQQAGQGTAPAMTPTPPGFIK